MSSVFRRQAWLETEYSESFAHVVRLSLGAGESTEQGELWDRSAGGQTWSYPQPVQVVRSSEERLDESSVADHRRFGGRRA